jgi:hypothetical protein
MDLHLLFCTLRIFVDIAPSDNLADRWRPKPDQLADTAFLLVVILMNPAEVMLGKGQKFSARAESLPSKGG